MAHEDASATADHSAVAQTETSASEKPVETTHEANSDGLNTANATLEDVVMSNALGGDSDAGRKRNFSQLDNCEEAPRSPKTARIANEPELESNAEEVPLMPGAGALAILETNLRSTALSTPTEPSELNEAIKIIDEDAVAGKPNFRIQEDDRSSGLSSPSSYDDDDDLRSSNPEHQQGCRDAIDPDGAATPPSSINSADEPNNMYSTIKVSGRVRNKPKLLGDFVATASVIEGDEPVDSEPLNQPSEDPDEASLGIHKQAKAARKTPKQSGRVTRTREAERMTEDKENKIQDLENRGLFNIKGTAPSRKKTDTVVKNQSKSKTNPSKAQKDNLLRKLASASPLARWMLNTSAQSQDKRLLRVFTVALPEVDPDLLALSEKMAKREALEEKPAPQGQPEVWSPSRQALTETPTYFKSRHSGSYHNDGHVYGFLFDSIGHCREYMDENVIICRAGGSMESDGSSGMAQRKDHSVDEAQVKAVLNDMAHHNPTVVICGDRNATARCKMPHKYCVFGWYKPTLVWSEKTAGKGGKIWTTIKYRLERLNTHLPAWHAPKDALLSEDEQATVGGITTKTCGACHSSFPQIYLGGWMCLNDKCAKFWKFHGVVEAPYGNEKSLSYHPAFLLHRSELWNESNGLELEPAPIRPPVPDIGHAIGDNLTYINTRGICCPNCGRCNSRRFFKGWICEVPGCDFELSAMHRPVSPTMLHTPWDVAQTLVRNRKQSSVSLNVMYKYGYKISVYTFHGIPGAFIHASATKPVIQEKNGPDDMFENMQTVDMGLERRTFMTKKPSANSKTESPDGTEALQDASTELDEDGLEPNQDSIDGDAGPGEKKPNFAEGDLMTAFSMNYGMPYKFVASGGSKPFEEGPWPISETRRRLNWAAMTFLNDAEQDMDLNELLVFAYLESQKLEYHDDGEEGLGPRIATLSLGGKAKMHMRMKGKFYVGCSKTGILVEEKPVAGGLECEKRLQAWTELQHLKATDRAAYNRRRKEIPKELGLYEKRLRKAEDLVTVTLSHGDIVIMDGYDIQKYLEHKVVSEGYLRFALTCRTVLENHLKPEERPLYEVRVDEQTYDGPDI